MFAPQHRNKLDRAALVRSQYHMGTLMTRSAGQSATRPPLRLGIAGLGTVGGGLVRLIAAHGERIAESTGREIKVDCGGKLVPINAPTTPTVKVAP